ncbi:MAG: ABC transporter substrate-binding protein [Hungatella hathewayi]|uniref:ABC transporter substrate-binding protein n=1 Tax=Hungatella TaxID=1649459 RepID=UPI001105F4A5|nr:MULTISPECIES: ABC transporter substrate-binding protein [Hungatella]MCI6453359.1 ABC transporter substrate-binding protein [Hungatella sp.]MCI7385034.1 ABC transporter substrate-binding protein [Hungatella sp.]MCQ5385103.1 ABC transporter substrate-binding protein [Hungatella hathewayi]MDY6237267.1 ABC transporter substrate-binding protein [Hungatella hathewayi]
MRKVLPVLMALAMTAAALTGCAKGAGETAAEATTAAAAEASTETSAEETAEAPETESETETESTGTSAAAGYTLRIGSLKGPTSMGLVELMDQAAKGEAKGSYEFTMVTAADELLGKIVSGDLDVALVPSNMASIIFNKTNHGVNVLNINTLGVLYVVSSDDSIKSIADLKGKTVYLTGKGTTPDYALQYLLKANGMTTDDVTLEYKSEPTEVAALLKEKPDAIGLLPQPFVTVAMAQNDTLKMVLDLTKEWDAVSGEDGGSLVTGVTICRGELFEEHADAIQTFMEEQKASAAFANENVAETAKLVAAAGIIEKAPVAEKAIPYCSITYIDGTDMKNRLYGYLSALYEMDPATVGGELPTKDFFYIP